MSRDSQARGPFTESVLLPCATLLQATPVVAIAPLIIIWVRDPTVALVLCATLVAEFVAGAGGTGAGLAYEIPQAGVQINIPRLFPALVLISMAGVALPGTLARQRDDMIEMP